MITPSRILFPSRPEKKEIEKGDCMGNSSRLKLINYGLEAGGLCCGILEKEIDKFASQILGESKGALNAYWDVKIRSIKRLGFGAQIWQPGKSSACQQNRFPPRLN